LITQDGLFNDGDWIESKDQDPNGDVRLIQLADIGDGVFRDRSERFLTTGKAQELQCTFLRAGDVLISRLADPLGRACIFPEQSQLCVAAVDVCIFRSGQGGVDENWLMHFINSTYFRSEIELRSSGTTRTRISRKHLGDVEMRVPPLAEQQRIAAKIEALQERGRRAREALAEVGSLLEQFRQSVLTAAFRGDLTADWRAAHPNVEPASELLYRIRADRRHHWEQAELAKYEAKGQKPPKNWQDKYEEPEPVDDIELPELPEGWGYTRIDALLSQTRPGIKTGPFGSLVKKHEQRRQGVPVLGIENIGRMRFVEGSKIYITAEKAEYLSDYDVYPNDILISRSGTVGEVCIVPESVGTARFSTNIIRVVLAEDGMSSTFFGYMIMGSPFVKRQISEACAGSTRDFLNKTILESLVFPLPPIAEQDVIVGRLERLFNWTSTILDIATDCMEDLNHLDQSILAKAFRGELVSQDPNDEPASVLLARIREQRAQQAEATKGKKKTATTQRGIKTGKQLSKLAPQQLTLVEVL